MALTGYNDFDDIFGRMDRMVNNMVNNMFGGARPDPFGMMDNMLKPMMMRPFGFGDFQSQMQDLTSFMSPHSMMISSTNGFPGGNFSYSSSVTSITTDANGRPLVYEASESSRVGPNGVKETRSSVRDSASGMAQMSIGHHLQDRAHIMQRSKNYYTGEEEAEDQYVNIDPDTEAQNFEEEWRNKMYATSSHSGHPQRSMLTGRYGDRGETLALPAPESTSHRATSPPVNASATASASTSSHSNHPSSYYQSQANNRMEVSLDSGEDSIDVVSHFSPASSSSSRHSQSSRKHKSSKKYSSRREKKPYRRT